MRFQVSTHLSFFFFFFYGIVIEYYTIVLGIGDIKQICFSGIYF